MQRMEIGCVGMGTPFSPDASSPCTTTPLRCPLGLERSFGRRHAWSSSNTDPRSWIAVIFKIPLLNHLPLHAALWSPSQPPFQNPPGWPLLPTRKVKTLIWEQACSPFRWVFSFFSFWKSVCRLSISERARSLGYNRINFSWRYLGANWIYLVLQARFISQKNIYSQNIS